MKETKQAPATPEARAAMHEMMAAFEAFKGANDARLDEIEKKASADALLEEKVARILALAQRPAAAGHSHGSRRQLAEMIKRSAHLLLAGLAASTTGVACDVGAAAAQDAECYDAEVSARIVSQTPTVFPDCGDDCIVISWPWIVDLDVSRVHSGDVHRGSLPVLAVLHTGYRGNLGTRRWKLRRNDQGGFNLRRNGDSVSARCTRDTAPAVAYITPPDGQTLDDLRREGRSHYGRAN